MVEEEDEYGLAADLRQDRNAMITYVRFRDGSFGIRGPRSLLEGKEGQKVEVKKRSLESCQEVLGNLVNIYHDTDCMEFTIDRDESLPNDQVIYRWDRARNKIILRGPAETLVEGERVKVSKLDGNERIELVGERISLDGNISYHEMVRSERKES